MFCPVYPRPEFITPNPGVSADLSWADVTESTELQKEVVVRERHLRVGYAAMVTCRGHRGNETNKRVKSSDGLLTRETVSLNRSDSTRYMDIICTHMSSGEEKVQSLHNLESLPFLQREGKKKMHISNLC